MVVHVKASTPSSHPLLGWLVDPSLESEEAGIELGACAPRNKWQWRATDMLIAEEREELGGHEGMIEGRDDAGSPLATSSKKRSIFRKRRAHEGGKAIKQVSSTDAVTQEDFPNSMMPSMIHIQRESSRDSVECVLTDVFLIPNASSDLTAEYEQDADDCGVSNQGSIDSMTTVDTVVIDEQALEVDMSHLPCNIKVPTKNEQDVECVLASKGSNAGSILSATSSLMTAQDSGSDDDLRMADLDDMMESGDDWSADGEVGFEITDKVEDEQHCLSMFCYTCHAGDAVSGIEDIGLLMQGREDDEAVSIEQQEDWSHLAEVRE